MNVPVPPGRWTERSAPIGRTLLEVWAQRWAARPESVVLVDGWDRDGPLSSDELQARTARTAAILAALGAAPGARVLWSARATIPSVVALVATLRTGAVLVPLNPAARAAEVAHVVADARPVLAVVDRDVEPPDGVTTVGVDRLARRAAAEPASRGGGSALPQPAPSDDALIVYTSGTTGQPKGAVHTHASLLAGVEALCAAWDWRPDDRLVLSLPLFHVHGLCAGLFGTLAAGGSALVFDRFDEQAVLEAAAARGSAASMFFGVPTMYHRIAATGRVRDLAALRLCVSGSAPLAADLWHRFAAHGVAVLERYGMTETLLTLSNPLVGERRPGSVGVPLPAVEAAIEEPDARGVGELLVRGPSLCRGYWGSPAVLAPGDWFATGDLASVADDGYVTVRGRRTELIITGGHNVYPAEVEAVLARYPGVHEVAVVGLPSVEWGETVVAYVVGEPDLEGLRAWASTELASYKCPRELRLVDHLPRNALGKVMRAELR
jgi:malonyl-CoA/methylmalonyl-CoA synthetase